MKRCMTRGTGLVLPMLLLLVLALPTSPVNAHQNGTPSPNGVSPWHYSESWVLSGYHYGEETHVDQHPTYGHLNDHYALDFALPGNPCWQRLYPIWDNMTVTVVNGDVIEMQKTIDGFRYRLRYRHLNSIVVGVGQTVHGSTLVGYTGDRGNAVGCHLHMSVHRYNAGTGWWESIPPQFCGRTYPHDHGTRWKGC